MSETPVCSKQDTLRLLAETARLRHENERLRGALEKIATHYTGYEHSALEMEEIARQALEGSQ